MEGVDVDIVEAAVCIFFLKELGRWTLPKEFVGDATHSLKDVGHEVFDPFGLLW